MAGRVRIAELFYELNANTTGLNRDIADSERQLGRFAKFVKENPTVAVAGLSVALAGVALEAAHMAEDVDKSFRQMAVNIPNGTRDIEELRAAVHRVSDETGRLDEETRGLFTTISKEGVSSAAEIETRARAIEKFVDATNASTEATAEGLDQLMDLFQITADGADVALAKVASVAKGRSGVEDVLEGLAAAAPTIAKFGLDFDTAIRALTQLMDGYGISASQAARRLKSLDATEIRKLADDAHIAGDALKDLNDRAELARGGLDRLENKSRNEFSRAMLDLADRVLPVVTKAFQGWAEVLDLFNGTADKAAAKAAQIDIVSLGGKARRTPLSRNERNELNGALETLRFDSSEETLQLRTKTLPELQAFYAALATSVRALGRDQDQVFHTLLARTAAVIAEKQKLVSDTPAPTTGGPGGRKTLPQTEEEKAAAAAAAAKVQSASETVRKLFTDIRSAAESEIATGTSRAFEAAAAAVDKFTADAAEKRRALVQALATSKASPEDQAGALQYFDLQVNVGRATRAAAAQSILDRERAETAADFRATLAQLTGDAIAAMEEADRALLESKRSQGYSPEQLGQLQKVQEQLRTAKAAAIEVDGVLERLKKDASFGAVKPLQEMAELSKQEVRVRDAIATVSERVTRSVDDENAKKAALKILDEELEKIEGRRAELAGENANRLKEQAETANTLQSRLHGAASAIEGAANVAYGLVQVLGEGSSEIGKMVIAAGQLASGLAKATSADFSSLGTFEKFGVFGSILGGAIGIGNALFGGDSPEERARRQTIAENTEALQKLTEKVGLLGSVSLTGLESQSATAIAQRYADTGFLTETNRNEAARKANSTGIRTDSPEWQELVEAAKAFGVTVTSDVDTLKQAVRAILDNAGKLGEFADDFAGFTAQAEAARKVFGNDTAAQRLTDLATAATKVSPAVAKLFEGLDLAKPDDLEILRKRVQDFFAIMEAGGQKLTDAERGSLTGDQLLQFIEQIITGIDDLSPAAQSAADRFAAARQNLGTEFEILGDDAKAQLGKIAALYGEQGGALAQLVAGIDPADADNVQLLEERIKALFQQLQSSPDSVDLAGLSIDQFIQALLDLKRGADAAAGGVEDAAQRMQAAANALRTDFEVYGTNPAQQAQQLAQLYAGVGGIGSALAGIDLSNAAGRGAAITALQQLYGQDKGDDEAVAAILDLLRAIRAVPEETAAGASKPTTETSGAERITIQQADRLISLTETLVVFARQTAQNTRALEAFLTPATYAPVAPPALAADVLAARAGATSSALRIELRPVIIVHFHGPVGAGADGDALGQQIGSGASTVFDAYLGTKLQAWDQVRGSPFIRTGA